MNENGTVKATAARVDDFTPDDKNANKGTVRGRYMLETSYERVGAGRGIVVDKHGKVIAGNKSQEIAIAQGIEDAIVVETDGTQLVVTKRLDMDLDDPDPNNPARQYAYLDNRAGEVGLEWSAEQVQQDLIDGVDLSAMFTPSEIAGLLPEDGQESGPLTVLDQGIQLKPSREYVVIMCEEKAQFDQLREVLGLQLVRRGGYAPDSMLDEANVQRVITASYLLEKMDRVGSDTK